MSMGCTGGAGGARETRARAFLGGGSGGSGSGNSSGNGGSMIFTLFFEPAGRPRLAFCGCDSSEASTGGGSSTGEASTGEASTGASTSSVSQISIHIKAHVVYTTSLFTKHKLKEIECPCRSTVLPSESVSLKERLSS